jgi:hypothetical protein
MQDDIALQEEMMRMQGYQQVPGHGWFRGSIPQADVAKKNVEQAGEDDDIDLATGSEEEEEEDDEEEEAAPRRRGRGKGKAKGKSKGKAKVTPKSRGKRKALQGLPPI